MTRSSCPICGAPRASAFAPFCSAPCRDRDLLKWLGDGYALPGPALDPEDDPEGFAPRPRTGEDED